MFMCFLTRLAQLSLRNTDREVRCSTTGGRQPEDKELMSANTAEIRQIN